MIKYGQERLAEAMLKPVNPALVILLGVFTVVWGIWVGNPFWDVFTRAALYSVMNFMPEWTWGLIAVVSGIAICYGAIRRSTKSLIWGARIGGAFWLAVTLMYFLGDWMSTGGITALVLAIYCGVLYLNFRVNNKKKRLPSDMYRW